MCAGCEHIGSEKEHEKEKIVNNDAVTTKIKKVVPRATLATK